MTNVAIAFPRNPIHLAHQADRPADAVARAGSPSGWAPRSGPRSRSASAPTSTARWRGCRTRRCAAGDLRRLATGERLDFRGEYYRHTLMTPNFTPRRNPYGPPPIYVGALGPRLTGPPPRSPTACWSCRSGRSGSCTRSPWPACDGLAAAGRDAARLRDGAGDHRVGRPNDPDHAATRRLLAFYGSTPAYRPVLDVHGWGELQPSCTRCPSRAAGPRWAG